MARPSDTDLRNAYRLVQATCGYSPGSLAQFFGDVTGKARSCGSKLSADFYDLMAKMWLSAGMQKSVSAEMISRYKAHGALEWQRFNSWLASKGPDAAYDDFKKANPIPTLARSYNDGLLCASKAAVYFEQAAVARGIAAKLDRNFFQQIADGFKDLPEFAKFVGGVIGCVESGECKSLSGAMQELVRKRWAIDVDTGTADELRAATEVRRLAENVRIAAATAEKPIVRFIKSPIGVVAIGGVALTLALVVSTLLDR